MHKIHRYPSIVLDNGSGMCKAGFSGNDGPTTTFHSVVGRPLLQRVMLGMTSHENYIGDGAQRMRGILQMKYPISNGIVTNWDDMEKIWHHVFSCKLRVNPGNHPVLITEAPRNPTANRERMAQLLFEKFHSPATYIATPAVLSLYATGRTTGVVLDSGKGVTHSLPVCEGYVIPTAVKRVDFGGEDVTKYLTLALTERAYSLKTSSQKEIVREMKETLCFVSRNYEQDVVSSSVTDTFERCYELPDGQVITVGNERFRCPEILFRPSLIEMDGPGFQDMIHSSVAGAAEDTRSELWQNVIISGGNTLFGNITDRLKEELASLAPFLSKIRVIAPPERLNSAWIGGSILSSLSCFHDTTLSKRHYEEYGPSIIHRKFA